MSDPNAIRYAPSTLAVHADDGQSKTTDVAPPLHVSTTYRYPRNPEQLVPLSDEDTGLSDPYSIPYVYSRVAAPNHTRLEEILASVLTSDPSQPIRPLTYGSGLAAFHALLCYFNPRVVAIGDGYHGCHGVLDVFKKVSGCKVVDVHDESTWGDLGRSSTGDDSNVPHHIDIVHMETPLNPSGIAYNIEKYAKLAHDHGAILSVDATFGPPGLQDPFLHGADVVMHSGTKYIGGHSDMLCGILAVKDKAWFEGLWKERLVLGATMGNMEAWLGVRSMRTLELRVQRQSKNAARLVQWLVRGLGEGESAEAEAQEGKEEEEEEEEEEEKEDGRLIRQCVQKVEHASLQKDDMAWLAKQMPNGFGPVFGLYLKDKDTAKRLPAELKLFHHATSLGGVESLIEWRIMSDSKVDPRLCRVSVGVEAVEDLIGDFRRAFAVLAGGGGGGAAAAAV